MLDILTHIFVTNSALLRLVILVYPLYNFYIGLAQAVLLFVTRIFYKISFSQMKRFSIRASVSLSADFLTFCLFCKQLLVGVDKPIQFIRN